MSHSRFRLLSAYLWRQHANKDVFQQPIIESDESGKKFKKNNKKVTHLLKTVDV